MNVMHEKGSAQFVLEKLDACPACGATNIRPSIDVKDYIYGSGRYSIYHCQQCGIGFFNPRPVASEAKCLNEISTVLPTHGLASQIRFARLSSRIRMLSRHFSVGASRVCDVGCGDGFFAYALARSDDRLHVDAVDFSDTPPPLFGSSQYGGVDLNYVGYADFMRCRDIKYDVIFCRHMLEHVHDLRHWLDLFHEKLNPDGILILEVPRWDSVWFDIFGSKYSHLAAPIHLNQFTRESLLHHLRRFKILHLGQTHGMVLWPSLSIALRGVFAEPTSIVQYLLMPIEILIDRLSGRYSVLLSVAQKTAD